MTNIKSKEENREATQNYRQKSRNVLQNYKQTNKFFNILYSDIHENS